MRRYLFLIIGVFLIFATTQVLAEKPETFPYEDTPSSHDVKNDWFGNKQKTRKELEAEVAKKQGAALKAEAERRKALFTPTGNEESANTNPARRLTPRRVVKYQVEEERLLGAPETNSVSANVESTPPKNPAPVPAPWGLLDPTVNQQIPWPTETR